MCNWRYEQRQYSFTFLSSAVSRLCLDDLLQVNKLVLFADWHHAGQQNLDFFCLLLTNKVVHIEQSVSVCVCLSVQIIVFEWHDLWFRYCDGLPFNLTRSSLMFMVIGQCLESQYENVSYLVMHAYYGCLHNLFFYKVENNGWHNLEWSFLINVYSLLP